MKKLLLPIVAALAILTAAPAHGAGLDPSFGNGGITTASLNLGDWREAPVNVAAGPDGSVVVASRQTLLRYRSDGSLDPGFASGGAVALEQVEGLAFQIADVAVDGQGRVVVFGAAEDLGQTAEIPAYWVPARVHPTWAAVLRFDPTGALDRSFGGDGIVRTDLGMPRLPSGGSGLAPPLIRAVSGVVDERERPVFVGAAFDMLPGYPRSSLGWARRLVVRLTAAGDVDPGFGAGNGVAVLGNYGNTGVSIGAGGDRLLIWGGRPISRLNPDGTVAAAYDGAPNPADAVLDRRGRLLVLGQSDAGVPQVFRLDPNGALDRGFGRRGGVTLRPPGERTGLSSLTVDSRGRALLVGAAGPQSRFQRQAGRRILVGRLSPSGALDRRFGGDGWLKTNPRGKKIAFPSSFNDRRGWWKVGPEGVLDSRGRLLVATGAGAGLGGILLARYRLGR